MNILGVSCWYHDSAAALISEGRVIAAAEEEKFSRKKHDAEFPLNAIDFCLEEAGLLPADIDYVVFYDKPVIKFERILSSVISHAPRTLDLFRDSLPQWWKEKLHFRKKVRKLLGISENKVLFTHHHLSHAASAYLLSPFSDAAILTLDGVGEWSTASQGEGRENIIKLHKELRFPDSAGLLYSAFTAFLGFRVNNGEYKVMGMAPYGKPEHIDKVLKTVSIREDGSIKLDMKYFSFNYSVRRSYNDEFIRLFGLPRLPESEFQPGGGKKPGESGYYADIAASVQYVLEDILLKMARNLRETVDSENLCYAGGVALNSKANARLIDESGFKNFFIQPAASDAGGALGAALWGASHAPGFKRPPKMLSSYLGKEYSEKEIIDALKESGLEYRKLTEDELLREAAERLSCGEVAGWYQGRAEWGPRALGHRSILADPRDEEMKERVNVAVKFREPFRPFAPSVLSENMEEYFEVKSPQTVSRFMLRTFKVRKEALDKLRAVTHVDGSSRVQEVFREESPIYWKLINTFKDITGVGAILNTSFNLRGEPIVNSPSDAVKTYISSDIDFLVMDNYITSKVSGSNKG